MRQDITNFIPIWNIYSFFKIKNEYDDMMKKIDTMLTTDGWNAIQSNYQNDDILFDPINRFIYINTGIQYVPNINPSFITIDWVDRWANNIKKYQEYLTIDTIVPQVDGINQVSTWHIWLHPRIEVENTYLAKKRDTVLSNITFGALIGLGILIFSLI